MIGHYLLSLTPEQEDRLLTCPFEPIAHLRMNNPARCMVLAAMDQNPGASASGLTMGENRDERRCPRENSPGWRYEYACERFGTERVNAAIRNRILSNRARRVWGSAPDLYIGASYKPGHSSDFPF